MSNYYQQQRQFQRAQRQYDAQLPDDTDCPDCDDCEGTGKVFDDGAPDAQPITCPKCNGSGQADVAKLRAEAQQEYWERKIDEDRDRDILDD